MCFFTPYLHIVFYMKLVILSVLKFQIAYVNSVSFIHSMQFSDCHKNKSRNYCILYMSQKLGRRGQSCRSWKRCSGYVDVFDTVIGYKYVVFRSQQTVILVPFQLAFMGFSRMKKTQNEKQR